MFEAKLASGGAILKRIIEATKELCAEVNFEISDDGISMQTMDTSHVCLIGFQMTPAMFEVFKCDEQDTIGIHLETLSRMLKCADADDPIILRKQSKESDFLEIIIESKKDNRTSTVNIRLMSIESEYMEIPEQELTVEASICSTKFQRIMKDLAIFGDTVSIIASLANSDSDERIAFNVEGESGNITIDMKPDTINITDNVHGLFALRYMNTIAKASALAPTVQLHMIPDAPVCVSYSLEDDKGWFKFFLAPKMSDDDQETNDD